MKAISRALSPESLAPTGSAWALTLSFLLVDRYSLMVDAAFLDQRLLEILLMIAKAQNVLCRYHYDPLDRLIGTTSKVDAELKRFYCKNRLATEIQGEVQYSIFQNGEQLLAQQNRQGDLVEASLLVTDQMRSVLQIVKPSRPNPIAYSPYGHRPTGSGLPNLLGFNGERTDLTTGHYLLGNGYRAFNPMLMRFNSPDSYSPFGEGGLNPYIYCLGDPANRYDSSGHRSKFRELISRFFGKKTNAAFSPDPESIDWNFKLYDNIDTRKNPGINYHELYKSYRKKPNAINKEYKLPPKKIESANDLESIPYGSELLEHARNHKGEYSVNYILTKRNELVVGSLKHEVLADFTNSSDVITAGVITRTGSNSFRISNTSGHFLPSYYSIFQVEERLKNLGARVTTVRTGGETRLQRRIK